MPRILRLAAACLLALPLLACGNKGPLTLQPRPATEPAPAIEVDVTPADVERVEGQPLDESGQPVTPPDVPR